MEGICLPSDKEVELTISEFVGGDINDLKFWHITDVPGINNRIANYFQLEHKITTGYDLFTWFGSKGYNTTLLRTRLEIETDPEWWKDKKHRGNLDLLCSTLEARVEKHDLNWHEYPSVKAFATAGDEQLSSYTLTDIYGCNCRVAACLAKAGIENGEQLYQKYREMGHHFEGMRDWLRAQIPAECLEDEERMGNLEQICCTLEASAKRHNARGDTPPEARAKRHNDSENTPPEARVKRHNARGDTPPEAPRSEAPSSGNAPGFSFD
jgi:hypothetical protein